MDPKSKEPLTLGKRLRQRREELKLEAEDLAHRVQAPPKYIRALEEDDYDVFSAKIYALGFLKKTLAELSLDNHDQIIREFNNEWDVRMFRKEKALVPLPENRGPQPWITPGRLGTLAGLVLLGILIVSFGSGFFKFVRSPRLNIIEPQDEEVFYNPSVKVRGRAAKEGRLTINGREVDLDASGEFDSVIELPPGLNELEFLVEDRFGKTNRVIRHVLIR